MSDQNEYDFIKEFGGADPLAVEAVGMVIGTAVGAVMKGMTEAGLSEETAIRIVRSTLDTMLRNALRGSS